MARCTQSVGVPVTKWQFGSNSVTRSGFSSVSALLAPLRGDYGEFGEVRERLTQGNDARRPIPIVVAHEDFHRALSWRPVESDNILKPRIPR
jgi:hypothetical protein